MFVKSFSRKIGAVHTATQSPTALCVNTNGSVQRTFAVARYQLEAGSYRKQGNFSQDCASENGSPFVCAFSGALGVVYTASTLQLLLV